MPVSALRPGGIGDAGLTPCSKMTPCSVQRKGETESAVKRQRSRAVTFAGCTAAALRK